MLACLASHFSPWQRELNSVLVIDMWRSPWFFLAVCVRFGRKCWPLTAVSVIFSPTQICSLFSMRLHFACFILGYRGDCSSGVHGQGLPCWLLPLWGELFKPYRGCSRQITATAPHFFYQLYRTATHPECFHVTTASTCVAVGAASCLRECKWAGRWKVRSAFERSLCNCVHISLVTV